MFQLRRKVLAIPLTVFDRITQSHYILDGKCVAAYRYTFSQPLLKSNRKHIRFFLCPKALLAVVRNHVRLRIAQTDPLVTYTYTQASF